MIRWAGRSLVAAILVLASCGEVRAAAVELRLRAGAAVRNDIFDSSRASVRDVGPLLSLQLGVWIRDWLAVGANAHGSFGLSEAPPELPQAAAWNRVNASFGGGVYVGARQRWTTARLGELLPALELGLGVRRVDVGFLEQSSVGLSREPATLLSASLTVHVDHPFPSIRGGYGLWFTAQQDLTHGLATRQWCFENRPCPAIADHYFVGGVSLMAGAEVYWGAR
jgi:hypothetical protein